MKSSNVVVQGSILGPLLFLVYINDICNCSNILNFLLFADDTNIFYSNKDIKNIFEITNTELKKLSEWFKANKLSLNVKKTKFTLFHRKFKADDLPLRLPNRYLQGEIERATTMKFLGIHLDQNLEWKDHIRNVQCKISQSLGFLYKARF